MKDSGVGRSRRVKFVASLTGALGLLSGALLLAEHDASAVSGIPAIPNVVRPGSVALPALPAVAPGNVSLCKAGNGGFGGDAVGVGGNAVGIGGQATGGAGAGLGGAGGAGGNACNGAGGIGAFFPATLLPANATGADALAAGRGIVNDNTASAQAVTVNPTGSSIISSIACATLLADRAAVITQFAGLIQQFPAQTAALLVQRNAALAIINANLARFGCPVPSGVALF